jgi:hypothetical protein
MSNTDRHRPYWVQIADKWEKNKTYNHWSGSGEANLLHKMCNCYMCSKYAYSPPPVKDRREARRRLRKGDWD